MKDPKKINKEVETPDTSVEVKKNTPMKMTFEKMKELNSTYMEMCRRNEALPNTKFGYAVEKFLKLNIISVFKEYNSLLADIRIEHALEDPETKAVISKPQATPNDRGFEYSRDGLKKVIKAENDLEKSWDAKEYDVEPYLCKEKDIPELNETYLEVFKGYVL